MSVSNGRYIPEHPLDAQLRLLGPNASPEQRLEVIWRAYEHHHQVVLNRPPASTQREAVHNWLREMRKGENFPMFSARASRINTSLHLSLSEKASRLAQEWCKACEPVITSDGKFPLYATFPIQVEPWSRQSSQQSQVIRDAVRAELAQRGHFQPWSESPLCVSVVSLVRRGASRKDVDNLVKGLLDSMQGVLYPNDHLVQCLTSRRVEYNGAVGNYFVSVRAVHSWEADVIYNHPQAPKILAGRRITLDAP